MEYAQNNPIIAGAIGSIIAAIFIALLVFLWRKYKNKYFLGMRVSRAIVFTSLVIASFLISFAILYFQTKTHIGVFTQLLELNSFIIYWLFFFLVGLFFVVIIPNWLREYDVFLSTPMSFNSDDEYQEVRKKCLQLVEILENECGFKNIYFAVKDIETTSDFNPGQNAVLKDLEALKRSKRFILYMPRKIHTSAIFEAGYALRKNLPTVYLCHDTDDLPFLMKDLNDSFCRVSKYTGNNFTCLKKYLQTEGKDLFRKSI